MTRRFEWPLRWIGGMALLAGLAGCGGGDGSDGGGGGPGDENPPPAAQDHTNIVLKDRFGVAIQVGSKEPYSPRLTCGPCHDVDEVSNAYHFQQGRTNAIAAIQTRDDFYGDGRVWLKSDGMYGKW